MLILMIFFFIMREDHKHTHETSPLEGTGSRKQTLLPSPRGLSKNMFWYRRVFAVVISVTQKYQYFHDLCCAGHGSHLMSIFVDRARVCALRYRLILMSERKAEIQELCSYYQILTLQVSR